MKKAEWMRGKYGIMVHYLPRLTAGRNGKRSLTPDEMADNFDVKAFADEAVKMGASWVIFPFGQNTGYYWSENPYLEEKIPGRCTKRDLIVDIADELISRGIRFIGYLPTEVDGQKEDIREAFGWDLSADKKEFMKRYTPFMRYYAEKLGTRLSGWWFDGNYNASEKSFLRTRDWTNDRFDREEWFAAAKAGNPDAVIAMCTGANQMGYVFEEEEYLAGEANVLSFLPWDADSREKQWHVLTWLDCFWMFSGGSMPNPKYSNKELYEYVRKCTDMGGAVTLNLGIFEDGSLAEKTERQICGLKKVMGNESYQLFQNKFHDGQLKLGIHMAKMPNGMPYELGGSKDGMYYPDENAEGMQQGDCAENTQQQGSGDGKGHPGCIGSNLDFMFNWMTSFVTGMAPLFYPAVKDEDYLRWANGFKRYYRDKVFETPLESMHDLGFLYSPYAVAMYRLTGDGEYREMALKAADELAKRFDIKGCYIDAWGRMDDDTREGRAIIDCMMNLPLLLWAWKETGHTYYRDIAAAHAEMTKEIFIREDYSVAHSFDFDRRTGKVAREHNGCGYGDGSWWARGTAWAVYGFAIIGGYLDKDEYRETAAAIAKAYISQLPEHSCVPVWDFRLPKDLPAKKCGTEPAEWDEANAENMVYNVDTSAAAIMASGLIELYEQTGEKWMLDFAVKSLTELSENYINYNEGTPGLLHHQNGQMHYTTYGDYFYLEAISKILYNTPSCW